MKFSQSTKFALLFVTLFSLAACSSTSEEAATEAVVETESGIDASTRRTQELAAEAAARAAAAAERIAAAALSTTVFYFEFDVSEFRSADRDVLTFHARDLAANSNKRIRLEGHADERGTREYNLALGERRGQAIERYLQVQGVSSNQLEVISYGEEQPIDPGTSDAAHARNRRVEIQ